MRRREFMASLGASALAVAAQGRAEGRVDGRREYYLLSRYLLQAGPQTQQAEHYFSEALVPALGRMGFGPVGAFKLDYGPETPTFYTLVPGASVEALAMIDLRLGQDENFLKAAASFWSAPAATPAYHRMESSLLVAFAGWPKLTPPAAAAPGVKRAFQLRTYESPSNAAHVRKVEMFHRGEFEIFQKVGCRPVFFGDTLVGELLPNLTYMLVFDGLQQLETAWKAFSADPDWKKLSLDPRYASEAIVSNISNLLLSPLTTSQIR